jgi:hypothetical protein
MNGYITSKDYTHLRELMDQGKEVICFVRWNFNIWNKDEEPIFVTDVCIGKASCKDSPEHKHYSFSSRGHGFGDYWPSLHKFTFEELCEKLELEYIEPNEDDFIEPNEDDFFSMCNKCIFFDGYDMCIRKGNFGSVTYGTKINCDKNKYFLEKKLTN